MRVAALISGLPRFTKDFNHTLNYLKDYSQIDWYFYLWNKDHSYDPKIPVTWPLNSPAEVYNKIKENLPENNKIGNLSIEEMPEFNPPSHYNFIKTSSPAGVVTMHYGIKQVNLLREQSGIDYDLVIRTRPDVSIDCEIYLDRVKLFLETSYPAIIMPNNARYGDEKRHANDQFAIALPEHMSIYARAINYLEKYNNEGVYLSGELLLAEHLYRSRIDVPETPFNCQIRRYASEPWI